MKIMDLDIAADIQNAGQLEKEGRLEEAATLYEDAIRLKTLDEHPYNRLMIIYRKLKQPKEELRVIKAGIAVFESSVTRKSGNKKLTELSNKMMQSAGLADKKGKRLYHPEPINRWMKRKEVVERRWRKKV